MPVAPDRVLPGLQVGVHGRVLGHGRHVTLTNLRVRAPGTRIVVPADLYLRPVQVGRRVQDQGADAGAELQNDGAGAGRTGGWLGHAALPLLLRPVVTSGGACASPRGPDEPRASPGRTS